LRKAILRRLRLVKLFEGFIARAFMDSLSVKRVSTVLYFHRGYGLGESTETHKTLYWEAPLTFTLWGKDGPVAGMAVEFRPNALCIRQLQGVAGTSLSPQERDWPKKFVQACISLALWTGIRYVRVYRADQSLFYHFPDFSRKTIEDISAAEKKHRERMRRRYDGTARQLGFVMKRKWGEWTHPKYARS
jgi:hypothetical protein